MHLYNSYFLLEKIDKLGEKILNHKKIAMSKNKIMEL